MNKLYLVIPLVLTLAFGGLYLAHSRTAEQKAEQTRLAAEQAAAEAAAQKAAAEQKAREDAEKRTAQRLAEEQRREDEKRARWEAAGRAIAEDTATFAAQAAKNAAELKTLQTTLETLRAEKARALEAAFTLDLEIEKARIAKRTAELEIQRLVEMTARRAGTTLAPLAATP
jgi:hypothetical protein